MSEKGPKNLSRRSFLKIIGTSLLSHFVFLNLSKKSWAAPAEDIGGQENASGGITPDKCTWTHSVPDKCGLEDARGGIIPDICKQLDDPDFCGTKDAKGRKIPDICKPADDDPDMCEPPEDPDWCQPPITDPDKG